MMMSKEEYYRAHLHNKTIPEIRATIRELEQEIEKLKTIMADPEYETKLHIQPDERVRLLYTEKYLEKAKETLKKAGG